MSAFHDNMLLGAGADGYQISRSVRLRSSASAYFSRTPFASTPTTYTLSFWVKRGTLGVLQYVLGSRQAGVASAGIIFQSADTIQIDLGNAIIFTTTAVFRDPSAWYHVVLRVNASGTAILYVNNQQINSASVGANPWLFQGTAGYTNAIGRLGDLNSNYFDGYLTEINFIDGQALTPSSFGETDAVTGVWKPKKYNGTYGTNGFYLNFSDNSAATAAAIGKDYSGNGNNWTPNNISVTAGATYDSMLDVPTPWADGGNGRGNYAVLNPLLASVNNGVLSNANLTTTLTATTQVNAFSNTPLPTTGKWYFEVTVTSSNLGVIVGIRSVINSTTFAGAGTGSYGYYNANGNKYDGATATAYGTAWFGASRTDTIGVAYDADTRELSFYLNGVSQGVAFTVAVGEYYPAASHISGSGSHTEHWNFGQRPFTYTPPTGFKALNTQNLPEPLISNGRKWFDATLYTGNGSTQSIVNAAGFQPDLVWVKSRSGAYTHMVSDSARGNANILYPNQTLAEQTGQTTRISSLDATGFSVGSDASANLNAGTYVGWQWKESATAGFDIVTYTGNGGSLTVNHNLGVAPAMIIAKSRGTAGTNWGVWHKNLTAASYYLLLNSAAAQATAANTIQSTPTSTSVVLGASSIFNDAANMVMYLFAEVAGFSRFNSYTGNGSTDGPFVFCGFRPRWVMIKRTDRAGDDWWVYDAARDSINVASSGLRPNLSAVEFSGAAIDMLSNGFKLKSTTLDQNGSGGTYIFAAFAENPFKYSLAR